jgi:integrase
LFELDGQWIARDPASPYLYRFWRDRGNARTRRASLGTADLNEAKLRLAEIVVKGAPASRSTPLSIILENYCDEHGDRTATGKQARHAARLFLECWGKTVRVSAIDETKQKEFAKWSVARGHSLGYVARNFNVLAAAMHRAKIATNIFGNEARMREVWRIEAKAPRSIFIPADADLARLWAAAMPENLRRWILISMGTGCRPAAALDLEPAARIRQAGLLNLLPEGRAQNKKVRPTVREPKVLTAAINRWEKAGLGLHNGRYCGYASRHSIRQALDRACALETVNLPRLNLYSFRHKVATVLRAAKVPVEQIEYQLGHRSPHSRTTAGYGEWSPDYLSAATDALEAWIRRIQRLAAKPSKSQDNPKPQSRSTRKAA